MGDPEQTAHAVKPAPFGDKGYVAVPGRERFSWLRAAFSTRAPGASQAYGRDELNLGWTPEEPAATVIANRRQFLRETTGDGEVPLATLSQIHGTVIHDVLDALPAAASDRAGLRGDGLTTSRPGLALGILTADCVPVFLVDTEQRAVAAFHAGWRGTLAGIVGQGVALMQQRYGAKPQHLLAAIGPSIRVCCFEVGEEVRSAFVAVAAENAELFTRPHGGKSHLDLQEANRRQLLAAGLAPHQVTIIPECTSCSRFADGRRKYFSYRAEGGRTGRMLNVTATLEN